MSESITLTFSVAPSDAAAAGVDTYGEIALQLSPSTLSEPARRVLAALLRSGKQIKTGTWLLNSRGTNYQLPPIPLQPTSQSAHAWLEQSAYAAEADEQAYRADQESRINKALDASLDDWITPDGSDQYVVNDAGDFASGGRIISQPKLAVPYYARTATDDARIQTRLAEIEGAEFAAATAAWAEKKSAYTAWATAAAAARKAAALRRPQQLAEWLATRGSEAMRKRAARGLLPEADLVAAIRDEVFAPLADLPRYERIDDAEVRRVLDADDDQAVVYVTRDAATCSDEDLALIERVEALLPGAKVELREHLGYVSGYAGSDDPELSRYSLRVTLTVGELTLSREYAAAS